ALFLFSTSLFAQDSKMVLQYSPDSAIMATGVIKNNLREGLWKYYTPETNTLLTEGFFKNGIRDGLWTSFYSDGKKNLIAEYKEGRLFGPSKKYDADGALRIEMVFQDSVLVGKYVEY